MRKNETVLGKGDSANSPCLMVANEAMPVYVTALHFRFFHTVSDDAKFDMKFQFD